MVIYARHVRGKNSVFMEGDLHKSAGWVPCHFSTTRKKKGDKTTYVDLKCVNGKLTRDYSVPDRERKRLNAIDAKVGRKRNAA